MKKKEIGTENSHELQSKRNFDTNKTKLLEDNTLSYIYALRNFSAITRGSF